MSGKIEPGAVCILVGGCHDQLEDSALGCEVTVVGLASPHAELVPEPWCSCQVWETTPIREYPSGFDGAAAPACCLSRIDGPDPDATHEHEREREEVGA